VRTCVSLNLYECFLGEWEKGTVLHVLAVQKARGDMFWWICGSSEAVWLNCRRASYLLAAERSLVAERVYNSSGCFVCQALGLALMVK